MPNTTCSRQYCIPIMHMLQDRLPHKYAMSRCKCPMQAPYTSTSWHAKSPSHQEPPKQRPDPRLPDTRGNKHHSASCTGGTGSSSQEQRRAQSDALPPTSCLPCTIIATGRKQWTVHQNKKSCEMVQHYAQLAVKCLQGEAHFHVICSVARGRLYPPSPLT